MRKILAVILLLTTIVTLFTACKKDGDDTTTQDPLYTVYTPGVSGTTAASNGAVSTTQKANAVSPVGSTYVLTTNADKKAPWYSTTRFVPGETTATTTKAVLATTTNSYDDITYTTGTIAPVVATTSSAQSTTWQTTTTTTAPTTTTTTKATTTKPETTTEEVEPEGVDVTINDMYTNENVLYVSIDSSDWGSKIKSNSGRVDIYVDGVKADKQATIQISSSTNGDGFQSVFVDISKYDVIDYGGTISFTVPEGFLTNSAGTKYNYAFEVSMQG